MPKESKTIAELEKRIQELETQVSTLETDLIHDPLTGLKTRAFFEKELSTYLASLSHMGDSKRRESFGFTNISVIFFDIDYFKKVNDTYGHDVGDKVLQKVSETIRGSLRTDDTPARWGGEEIIATLLGANEQDAIVKAEETRARVEAITFPDLPDLHVTISAGVAATKKGMSISELVKCADQALYSAKNNGRNKVVAYSSLSKV